MTFDLGNRVSVGIARLQSPDTTIQSFSVTFIEIDKTTSMTLQNRHVDAFSNVWDENAHSFYGEKTKIIKKSFLLL